MKKRILSGLLACLLCVTTALFTTTASAAADYRLTIHFYLREDNDNLPGAQFHLYQVASGNAQSYQLTKSFAGFTGALTWSNADEQSVVAQALADHVDDQEVEALRSGVTGADGKLTFDRLDAGLYLVLGDEYTDEDTNYKYTVGDVLIWLPYYNEIEQRWQSAPVAAPKPDRKPNRRPSDPSTPSSPSPSTPTPTPTPTPGWPGTPTTPEPSESVPPSEPVPSLPVIDEPVLPSEPIPGEPTPNEPVPSTPAPSAPSTPTPTPDDPDQPKLPQTGQTWWPVPVLLVCGLGLFATGMLLRRPEDEDEVE